jgi:endonuclease/exonuclease/phosphatase family metal-dependent hydrolase
LFRSHPAPPSFASTTAAEPSGHWVYHPEVATTTIALGVALIVLGLAGYGLTGAVSLTALIPAGFGLLVLLAGLLARDERWRMHAMHGAVVVALVGFLGSVRGLLRIGEVFDGTAARPAAIVSQAIMALLTLVYVVLAVRSFVLARRARRAGGALAIVLCAGALTPMAAATVKQESLPRASADDLRIVSYNIKHGQTNAECGKPAATPGRPPAPDCNLDLQASIGVIRALDPDVVGLQEVDRFWARSGYQDEPAVLSAALRLSHQCYAANLDHPADDHADRPHQYGTLILSRLPIVACRTTPLPRTGANEQRGFTLAEIDVRGTRLQVYNTHLHITAADRALQTAAIAEAIDAAGPAPRVLVGDFNARPTATELAPVLARFVDAWAKAGAPDPANANGFTSPARPDGDPTSRIDYVFVSASIDVRSARVPVNATTRLASDHYPVVVDLRLPGATGA